MVDGELTRPEIRFIRIYMDSTLSSCDDLLRIFAPQSTTRAEDAVPMIIYSGTRNRTFQVMKVVNEARETKRHEYDPKDGFIRRYHAVTGDQDKEGTIGDFGKGSVPVISATMALGLGQNLKRVRCVIHMGRGDPAAIVQMVGRCGRDGNVGLGILFMEPTRKNGRNSISDFVDQTHQDDDARMDALAVTKCCLRIALTLDNKAGYIPLSDEDPKAMVERARENRLGFAKCKCSNCLPAEADALINVIQQANVANFDALLNDPYSLEKDPRIVTKTRKRKMATPKGTCSYPQSLVNDLVEHLLHQFDVFYYNHLGPHAEFPADVFFGEVQARSIVGSIDQVISAMDEDLAVIEKLIGGQCFSGQLAAIRLSIKDWMEGDCYLLHLGQADRLDRFIEEEGIRVRQAMAEELARLQGLAEAKRAADKTHKAAFKAAEKARVAQEKADRRLAVAEDKAWEKQLMAAEKQAEKTRLAEEKRAAKTRATRDRAAARKAKKDGMGQANNELGPQGPGLVQEAHGPALGLGTGDCIPMVTNSNQGETRLDLRHSKRAQGDETNKIDEEEKLRVFANRRANADAKREFDSTMKANGIRRRRQDVKMKLLGAQAKREKRGQLHTAKVLRTGQLNAEIDSMRTDLLRGGALPDQSSSGS
ncbi:hypothetical protein PGTUg99_037613 [Puccinia graminis f. sp. tritici]|nr:hypothetical protein PGTUg99_037613 [Puccinia graminis f. sp. tritici]